MIKRLYLLFFTLIACLALSLNFSVFAKDITEQLVIIGTTDVHGNLHSIDYFTNKPQSNSLVKIYTKVKEIRSKYKNTLLLDAGDLIVGTPLANYYALVKPEKENPLITVYNTMGYDAFNLGNHEFGYTLEYLDKVKKEAKYPLLSANIYIHNTDKPAFKPYIIKNVNGIKVGIIGFIVPETNVWRKVILENKMDIRDAIESAKIWMPKLENEKPDVIVCLSHLDREDAYKLANLYPQIDVIITGHTHEELEKMLVNGVLITQPYKYAKRLAVVTLDLKKVNKAWKVTEKDSKLINIETSNIKDDEGLVESLKQELEETIKYVDRPIGTSTDVWCPKDARLKDTPIVDLINKVQLEVTGADLSTSPLFEGVRGLKKGEITRADILNLYKYENTLVAIKISGKQLKEYLEHSAKYFNTSPNPDIINKKVAPYDYDMISGVDYKIDVSKAVGQRIIDLTFKGKPVTDDMTFSLALNNFRQKGGGYYNMIENAPVVYDRNENVRDLIIKYIEDKKIISPKDVFVKNWEIIHQDTPVSQAISKN